MYGVLDTAFNLINAIILIDLDLDYIPSTNFLCIKLSRTGLQLFRNILSCHIIDRDVVADKPTKLDKNLSHYFISFRKGTARHTLSSKLNFRMTFTSSRPIKMPVWRPTLFSKARRWLFNVQENGSSGGESMYWILVDVYGRRLFVVHPSKTSEIRETVF